MWKHFGHAGRGVGRGVPQDVHAFSRGGPFEYARIVTDDVCEGRARSRDKCEGCGKRETDEEGRAC